MIDRAIECQFNLMLNRLEERTKAQSGIREIFSLDKIPEDNEVLNAVKLGWIIDSYP